MPNRLEATYRRAFRAIFGTPELTDVAPTSYLTGMSATFRCTYYPLASDFEKALQNVLKEMFPRARGRLCHFHQCQAYFKNIQKKGLLPLYEIEEVKVMLRCYGALALLPVDDVINGYNVVTRALKALVPAKIPSCYRDRLNGKRRCLIACTTCGANKFSVLHLHSQDLHRHSRRQPSGSLTLRL